MLHYRRTGGAKPAIVLLHGLMGSGGCWTSLAGALESAFDVIMPDARGHGRSDALASGYRYDDHARDVIELMAALSLSRPVVLGHSMGGMTAAVVASRASLGGLVLVDPTFLDPERQRDVYESDVAAEHRRTLSLSKAAIVAHIHARHPHRSMEMIEQQAEARLQTSLAAFEVLAPPNPDFRELVRAFNVPTLLVIGDRSPVVSLELATELKSSNPQVHIEVVPGAGHGLPFDAPARIAEIVLSFLRTRL